MNRHHGMCDASCAIPLGERHFLVADDERNVLCVYDAASSGGAAQTIPLDTVLPGVTGTEVDLEGAAVLGSTVYWISSHGRTAKGRRDEGRYVFFATHLHWKDGEARLELAGAPVTRLLEQLLDHESYGRLGLGEAARRAPKDEGGLNIEGLAPARTGGLLVGFRSPLVRDRALIAILSNPAEMIAGKDARFGPPLLVDLDGMGVRGLERWPERDLELVIAGPVDGAGVFRLHVLDSDGSRTERALPKGFNAEAVVSYPGNAERVLLLSDDGSVERSGRKAKKLPPDHPDRYFRSTWIEL